MNRPVINQATWERIVLDDDTRAIYILTESDGSREVFLLPNKAPLTPGCSRRTD